MIPVQIPIVSAYNEPANLGYAMTMPKSGKHGSAKAFYARGGG